MRQTIRQMAGWPMRVRPLSRAACLTVALSICLAAGAYVLGGPSAAALVIGTAAMWCAAAVTGAAGAAPRTGRAPPLTGRPALLATLDTALGRPGGMPMALVVEVDRYRTLGERLSHEGQDRLGELVLERLSGALRGDDCMVPLAPDRIAIALVGGEGRVDLNTAMQLAARLQRRLAEPITVEGIALKVSVSIGFAVALGGVASTGRAMLQAATLAALEAHRNGPSAIRSYSDSMATRLRDQSDLARTLVGAFDRGEVTAHFQPQIDSITGELTGLEALVRWYHPDRGLIPPSVFLPALARAGLADQLAGHMVRLALGAIQAWDAAGVAVPSVSVNFSTEELCDPRLVDRIAWELDRHNLAPDRLVVEVLETVVANGTDDPVIRNLASLARLGCRIDLDDFGTGHAAITSIRRFQIERIKIDRGFVTGVDIDPEQQKMVAAILTMAERLGLQTLAEGVETEAEARMLAKLGCGHLQGFGIGRPMPEAMVSEWIDAVDMPERERRGPLRAG